MAASDSFLGTGWAFPPSFSAGNFQLLLSSGENNIEQSICLIFSTVMGSRPLAPEFGTNLSSYIFRRIDAGVLEEIRKNLSVALLNNEPRIGVEKIDFSQCQDGTQLLISVFYAIHETNTRHNYVYPFSLLEASNL